MRYINESYEEFLNEMAMTPAQKKKRRKERREAKKRGISLPRLSSKKSKRTKTTKKATSKKMTSKDISIIEDSLPNEKWIGRNWLINYFTAENNGKFYIGISAEGKRGYPRDAYIKALNVRPPALPSGYTYATGDPVNMYTDEKVTMKSIKQDDEYYSDRGYTEYEFNGEVFYEVTKK